MTTRNGRTKTAIKQWIETNHIPVRNSITTRKVRTHKCSPQTIATHREWNIPDSTIYLINIIKSTFRSNIICRIQC